MRLALITIFNQHARKAQQSEYDRSVCIHAISKAREEFNTLSETLSGKDLYSELMLKLEMLFQNYHDPDGQYTNGKGVIGALLADLYLLKPDQ